MSISILYPILYLFIGLIIGKFYADVKKSASALLSKWVIPFVIIYNLATYQAGMLTMILAIMVMMTFILSISQWLFKDNIRSLCLCYLNIGWLGLPIVSSLYGDEAAKLFISAYVGSSLFGNSIGVTMLLPQPNFKATLIKILKTPPFISLLIGILLIPYGKEVSVYLHSVYNVAKWLMGFLGMMVLGIWLAHSKINLSDFKREIGYFLLKVSLFGLLIFALIQFAQWQNITLITQNTQSLYLLALLPPAENLIILETHYAKTGRSATMIANGTILSIIAIGIYLLIGLW